MVLPVSSYVCVPGAVILVTGASSYIASHIIDILLDLGYNVRGTVRAEKSWLNQYFDKKYGSGRFETVLVPRMQDDDAFDKCFEGVSGVVHVAADLSFSSDPDVVIPITVGGVMNILKVASRSTSVKRVVITSSSAAATTPMPNVKHVIDESTWNTSAISDAYNISLPAEQKPWAVYAASKAMSEGRAWEFIQDQKPHFGLNSVVTNFNIGEILIPETRGSVSMGGIRTLLSGQSDILPQILPQWFVDVRDTARLHVAALLDPGVESKRLFAFAYPYNCTQAIQVLRKLRPQNKLIPNPLPDEGEDLSEVPPSAKALGYIQNFFGKDDWTQAEESLALGIKDLA